MTIVVILLIILQKNKKKCKINKNFLEVIFPEKIKLQIVNFQV